MLVLEAPGVELQIDEIEIEEIDPASFGLIASIHVAGRGAPEAHAMGALRTLVCATTPTCALASANPNPHSYPCPDPTPTPNPHPHPHPSAGPHQVRAPPRYSA